MGSVIGRTLDTHGSLLPLFAALAAPAVLVGSMSFFAGPNLPAVVVVSLVTVVISVISGAAMVIATDDSWRGVQPRLGDVLGRAADRAPALLGSALVVGVGMAIILVIAFAIITFAGSLTRPAPTASIALVVVVILGLAVFASIVGLRLALSSAAIALDGMGPIAGLRRSGALTRGHLWRLLGLYLALVLVIGLGTVGANLLTTYGSERGLAVLAFIVASIVSTAIPAIASTIVYRDLAGRSVASPLDTPSAVADEADDVVADAPRPADDVVADAPRPADDPDGTAGEAPGAPEAAGASAPLAAGPSAEAAAAPSGPPSGSGRRVSLIAVLGTGLIIGAAGFWTVVEAGGQAYIENRGEVIAGTSSNLTDPCRPTGVKTSFRSSERVWIGAVFSKHIEPGDEVVIEVYLDGELAVTQPVEAGPIGLDCYYETAPLENAPTGTWRIVIRHGAEVVADGSFTIR